MDTLMEQDKNFACHVFTTEKLHAQNKLSHEDVAKIAQELKNWAIIKGATHYTHWTQPLHGRTMAKQDSFQHVQMGLISEQFTADTLLRGEADGSSLPNGGLRQTAKARAYTIWDSQTKAFIWGKVLYIPAFVISYEEKSLDFALPLRKASDMLNQKAQQLCALFDPSITQVFATLGWEQEYFVIDKNLAKQRQDIVNCQHTLFGNLPSKHQQMEDHYYGAIPNRVLTFIKDLEEEAWQMGIPIKTRHNEVAPNQFECAPVFEEVCQGVNSNMLLQMLMQDVAEKHGLMVLLHEKPFQGINGSGKHNNFSLATNTGINVFNPGKEPQNNLLFLSFLVLMLEAVHEHSDLLLASIASSGNEHRLGAQEAPPAIFSVYLGEELHRLVFHLAQGDLSAYQAVQKMMNLPNLPALAKDASDRNRTSPFAYTGAKFELRAVGAAANPSEAMTVLQSILAHRIDLFLAEIAGKLDNILPVLQKKAKALMPILFEGNGYSAEWVLEAQKRGLPNIPQAMQAFKAYIKPENIKIFEKLGVYSAEEITARYHVQVENYEKTLAIEHKTLESLYLQHISHSLDKYIAFLRHAGLDDAKMLEKRQTITEKWADYEKNLAQARQEAIWQMQKDFALNLQKDFNWLEKHIPQDFWDLPKYQDLLCF